MLAGNVKFSLQQWLGGCFAKGSQRLTNAGTDALLVGTVFLSWLLFPVMLKLLAYTAFQVGFFIVSVSVLAILVRYSKLNRLEWSLWHKWFVVFWSVYLLFLLAASVRSGDLYSLKQYCVTLYKVMFFAVLLFYMKRNFIVCSFRAYVNLMVLVVVFASLVVVGVGLGLMQPIQGMTDKIAEQGYPFSVYWGAYYNDWDGYYKSFYVYRMQGFCEEPGTFALTILPALCWFLIVEKSHIRFVVIGLGVLASSSFGALLGLLFLLPVIWAGKIFDRKVLVYLMCMVGLFGFIKYRVDIVSLLSGDFSHFMRAYLASLSTGRLGSMIEVYQYLSMHPFGTGNALGMMTVDYPISVGYAVAMLESGIIGGIAYCAMFALLGWKALKLSLSVDMDQQEGRVHFVVAITVLILLFMGLQRQQPDLSLWHMWIYACFFYLTMKKDAIQNLAPQSTQRNAK